MKFHLNPETGNVSECRAGSGPRSTGCRFKIPDSQHGSTPDEARLVYEETMKRVALKSFKTRKLRYSPASLDTYMDVELLNSMIDEKFIKANTHPEDDSLRILCYTPIAQAKAKWNDATRKARGLIVQSSSGDFSDAVVIQRPWEKFFTISQIESGWSMGDEENEHSADDLMDALDFNAPAEVTDKMDGSMGVLYLAPNGYPALSTKGSFESEQALSFNRFMNEDSNIGDATAELLSRYPDTTFMFEMVGDVNYQVVLHYEKKDISMLGAVKKDSGLYLSTNDFNTVWKDKGLSVADSIPANTLGEALDLADREDKEGVVVRIKSDDPNKQMQIKIKQSDYLDKHRLRTGFSKRRARTTMSNMSGSYADFIAIAKSRDVKHFDEVREVLESHETDDQNIGVQAEHFQKQRLEFYSDALLKTADEVYANKKIVDAYPITGDYVKDKRDFAQANRGNGTLSLMRMFDAKLRGIPLEDMNASRLFQQTVKDN